MILNLEDRKGSPSIWQGRAKRHNLLFVFYLAYLRRHISSEPSRQQQLDRRDHHTSSSRRFLLIICNNFTEQSERLWSVYIGFIWLIESRDYMECTICAKKKGGERKCRKKQCCLNVDVLELIIIQQILSTKMCLIPCNVCTFNIHFHLFTSDSENVWVRGVVLREVTTEMEQWSSYCCNFFPLLRGSQTVAHSIHPCFYRRYKMGDCCWRYGTVVDFRLKSLIVFMKEIMSRDNAILSEIKEASIL